MKKLICLLVLLAGSCMLFAEEIKVKTGDVFGASMLDYFTPVEKSVSGARPVFQASGMSKKICGV